MKRLHHPSSVSSITSIVIISLWMSFSQSWAPSCLAQADDSYESIDTLMRHKLGSGSYNTDLRPVLNQSTPVNVEINFALMSVVQVDDVDQRFTLNGFLSLAWNDERISWHPEDYGGVEYLTPQPKHIWRPRILLWNTLGDRDLFKDDFSPLRVRHNGSATWNPGGLFRGACALNMEKYPFDEQWCYIRMCPMSHYWTKLNFVPSDEEFDLSFYAPSEGWDLIKTRVSIIRVETDIKHKFSSCPNFSFLIRRRPTFFIFNIILPVIVLSVMNAMVFIIPTESGEKIGYGITVLLSLSVFLTTVSTMVPQASNNIPLITIYLFALMMCSGMSVMTSIAVVYLHNVHSGEDCPSEDNTKDDHFFKKLFSRSGSTASVTPIVTESKPGLALARRSSSPDANAPDARCSKNAFFKVLSKKINRAGFITSISALVIINVVFMKKIIYG